MNVSTLRGRWGARLRLRFSLMSLGLGIAFGSVPLFIASVTVDAGGSTGIAYDIMGCHGSMSLLPVGGPYVCPDADYARGDLGPGWNELDLLPMRLTATTGSSAPALGTYQVATVADYMDAGVPGFDRMSSPVLNTALSSASCAAASVTPSGATAGTLSPGLKADTSIYRLLTLTQPAGTTCVYDYYQRIASGASANPGSSLHSELGTATVTDGSVSGLDSIPGVKTVQLPIESVTSGTPSPTPTPPTSTPTPTPPTSNPTPTPTPPTSTPTPTPPTSTPTPTPPASTPTPTPTPESTPTPKPKSNPTPTPTPAPESTPTPTPTSGVGGVTSTPTPAPSPTSGNGGSSNGNNPGTNGTTTTTTGTPVGLPSTGDAAPAVVTPNTGADLPLELAGLLLLVGTGLVGVGWRCRRPSRLVLR